MDKPLILVVDDDKLVADSLAELINDTNEYRAITAYSGKAALEQLSNNKILLGLGGNRVKLAFLDIKMPEINGLQLLEMIRNLYHDDIGIIMLTAYEDEDKWDKATSEFVVNYIKKPYKDEEILTTIKRYFNGVREQGKMVLETFEKHMEKREEWKKKSQ